MKIITVLAVFALTTRIQAIQGKNPLPLGMGSVKTDALV